MTHSAKQKFDIRNLVVSCLVAMAAVLSGCGEKPESEFQQIVRQSNCVTAKQVYSDYQNNEVAAQQKYQGKVNRICGIVEEIELNLMDEPTISLRGSFLGSVGIGGVDTSSAARLSKGSVAVFECKEINELLGTPILTECRMVPTLNVPTEAVSDTEVSNSNDGMPNNAMAFAGKYPSEKIGGYGILDAPDLQSTIKAMPNGIQIWSQIISENADLKVESRIDTIKPGRYQGIVIHKCEAHNCGGAGSRQLHIEYFPRQNSEERLVFVCILGGGNLQSFDSWGNSSMIGEECTAGGFDYGDSF